MTDAELGAALRRAGLTPRAVKAAWGTDVVAHLPLPPPRIEQGTGNVPTGDGQFEPEFPTPAAAVLGLLVAGADVGEREAERGLGPGVLEALRERGIVVGEARVRAPVSILPIGPSLLACDRDRRPDDSSHHLIGCLPPVRATRWLDVGTGCAIAPLARPDRGEAIVAAEVDPEAVRLARLGVALSGTRHVAVIEADLTAGTGDGFDLVTFNLPIPAEAGITRAGESRFRHAPAGADLLARFVAEVPARIAGGAAIIVHTWLGPPAAAVVDGMAGEVCVVRYTPDDVAPFAVVCWRPDLPARRRAGRRVPTAAAPHLTWDDLESARAH